MIYFVPYLEPIPEPEHEPVCKPEPVSMSKPVSQPKPEPQTEPKPVPALEISETKKTSHIRGKKMRSDTNAFFGSKC